jgi:hypothetical protein
VLTIQKTNMSLLRRWEDFWRRRFYKYDVPTGLALYETGHPIPIGLRIARCAFGAAHGGKPVAYRWLSIGKLWTKGESAVKDRFPTHSQSVGDPIDVIEP